MEHYFGGGGEQKLRGTPNGNGVVSGCYGGNGLLHVCDPP